MPATYTDSIDGLTTSVAEKAPVVVATNGAITLSGEQTVNGVACVEGDRVLVKDQPDPTENGIRICSDGAWPRALDFNGNRDVVKGTSVRVAGPSVSTGSLYIVTTENPIVIGTSAIVFVQKPEGTSESTLFVSMEDLRVSSTDQDYIETTSFYAGGTTGGAKLYRDGTGTPTGSGAAVISAALAAGTFCNAAGVCYKLKPDQLITDSMFGVTYDNSTDDTACINSCLTFVTGKTVCLGIAGETAKCNSLSVGNGTTVYFISAKYVRNGAANNPLITFGTDCLIYGEVELDGVKGTYTGSSNHGLRVGDNCVSLAKIISHDNYKHGIQYNGNNIHLLGTVTAYDNGTTPGGSGTGDGVYAVNSNNSSLKNYYCYDNARNGVSVTTYDGESLDPTLSLNFILSDGRATGNGYVDIDVEGVTRPRLHNVTDCGIISLNQSVEGDIENITCEIFSATSHDRIRVADVSLRPTGTVSNVFSVSGDSPNIDTVYMYDTASSYGTSSTILIDASVASGFDGLANVRNIVTENGYNAIVVSGCQVLQGCAAITATNRYLQVDSRRIAGTVAKQLATEIRGGVMHSQSALTGDPSANGYTGTFYQGDRVYRTDAVEAGAASSMYVISGYIYTTGWLQMRTLTGN